MKSVIDRVVAGDELKSADALALSEFNELDFLMQAASAIRDQQYPDFISYSPKVFIPLTQLCRDVCHYCTFAVSPSKAPFTYMSVDQAIETAQQGAKLGCKEALFTLGEKPELRYKAAREALRHDKWSTSFEEGEIPNSQIAFQLLDQFTDKSLDGWRARSSGIDGLIDLLLFESWSDEGGRAQHVP